MRDLTTGIVAIVIIIASTFAIIPTGAGYSNKQSNRQTDSSLNTANIQIYANDAVGKPYILIGKINVDAYSASGALKRLKRRAAEAGADAILNYTVATTYATTASGIAIRWVKDGEKGITHITQDTAIPVIR